MSLSVTGILPSCTSLGWTNSIDPNIPNSFRRIAHASPSKSLRVRSLCAFGSLPMFPLRFSSAELSRIYRRGEPKHGTNCPSAAGHSWYGVGLSAWQGERWVRMEADGVHPTSSERSEAGHSIVRPTVANHLLPPRLSSVVAIEPETPRRHFHPCCASIRNLEREARDQLAASGLGAGALHEVHEPIAGR